jgi:Tol biopolymer transport system component/predicted Ser/Thr protein kinase
MSAAGRSFGPYQILGPLGSGGMGEVYRARDQRLDRIVALKTSRTQFNDRMMKEARAVAALNHPHIATLYDVGPDYLVMELVEGETLCGPLPVAKALVYARQILDALAEAHRKGITHCDLKPANIMVCKSGVKLLDFGLAQIKQSIKNSDDMPTVEMSGSGSGTISGTLQYMAPEQFQSKPVDARTDIFAFGMVMYEMLSGQHAFQGGSPATLMHAILHEDPPPLSLPEGVAPPKLEWVIQRCLAKEADDRWQSAADIIHVFDLIGTEHQSPAAAAIQSSPAIDVPEPVPAPRNNMRIWGLAAAFVLGVLVVSGGLRLFRAPAARPWTFRPLTFSGRALRPSLSPDGKQVAFLWFGDQFNEGGVYVQLVNGGNPLRLPIDSAGGRPAWSPDGSEIAFVNGSGLYVMPALGGTARKITPFDGNGDPDGVSWAASRSFFVVGGPGAGLSLISAEGGELKSLTKPTFGADREPAISPDSAAVAFVRKTATYNSQLLLLKLKAEGSSVGEPKVLTHGVWDISGMAWTPDGKDIIFEGSAGSNNPSLWRIPRDGGDPVRLIMPGMISGDPTISREGRLVYISGQFETKIFKVALSQDGAEPQAVIDAIGDHGDLSVSPDGSHIAFASNRTGSKEIWIANANGAHQTQLTFFLGPAVGSPRWSPDGKTIAFDGGASGSSDIYSVPSEGGKPVRLTTDPGNEIRPSWSHDGKWIYYGWDRPGHDREIWKIPSSGGQPVRVMQAGYNAMETPDGKWLYVLGPSGIARVRPDGSGEEHVAGGSVSTNNWNLAASGLYLLDPKNRSLLRVPFDGKDVKTVRQFNPSTWPQGGGTAFAVPNDGSFAIYRNVMRSVNTLMLIEGFR